MAPNGATGNAEPGFWLYARQLQVNVSVSVSVREGTTFSVQWGPPPWLRRESFEVAGDEM
jgi:hypothetical protein